MIPRASLATTLYAFEAVLTEAGGKHHTAWAALIRLDDNGKHTLFGGSPLPTSYQPAGLEPAPTQPARMPPRRLLKHSLRRPENLNNGVRDDWFARARRELNNLPIDLTVEIATRTNALL